MIKGKWKRVVTTVIFVFTLILITGKSTESISTQTDTFIPLKMIPSTPSWNHNFTEATCLRDQRKQNEDYLFTYGRKKKWSLDPAIIAEKIIGWKGHMKTITPRSYQGRGIVFTCNPDGIKLLIISIRFLRKHGCELPIEVWHNDELEHTQVRIIERLKNVLVYNLSNYHQKLSNSNENKLNSGELYAIKAASILYSTLREVLYLDIGNMAMKDPTFLFDTPAYKETGTLFWKDIWKFRIDNPIFKILEIDCKDEYQQEAGQMVINKGDPGVFKALELAFYMQLNGDFYFQLIHGDKDTFSLAYRALGVNYHMVRPFMGIGGHTERGKFCGFAMIHFSPFWSSKDNGKYPEGYSDPSMPEILFVRKHLFKDQVYMKMDKIFMPNPENLLSGRGDLVKVHTSQGNRQCNTLSEYVLGKTTYVPVVKETKLYLPDFENDFERFARYDVSDPKAEISLGKGTELSVINSTPSWNYSYKEKSCRINDRDQNEYFYFTWDKKKNWPLDHSVVAQKTLEWKAYLEKVPERKSRGRGVIYTWHNGDFDENDVQFITKLKNVKVLNLLDYREKVEIEGRNYAMKGAILLYSKFKEILYLDIDNNPMKDPTFLFDHPAYKETGTIFWKDLWKTRSDNSIYDIMEVECTDEFQQESGQLVINKGFPGVLKALELAFYLQLNSDFYFGLVQGDKDTFKFAYRALGVSYHMVRPYLGIMGTIDNQKFCGSAMVQFAPYWSRADFGDYPKGYSDPPKPEILFVHKNFKKDDPHPKLDLMKVANPALIVSGKGDFEFVDGKACTTLRDYVKDSKVYPPVFEEVRLYLPNLEKDYAEFARLDF